MASIPDLTEQIKVYETKAYLISPMLQYLLKWVRERQCTNCAQKLKWKGHFSFGSTQNHKSWTAIARLFLIRDLLHFVNSIANSNQKEQQIKKRKWICLYLIYYGTASFSIYFGASKQYTYYVCIRQRLFEPAPQGLQTSLVYLDVCHSCATAASVASAQLAAGLV